MTSSSSTSAWEQPWSPGWIFVRRRSETAEPGRGVRPGAFPAGVDVLRIAHPYLSHLVPLALVLLETSGELIALTLIVLVIHCMFLRTTPVVP